MYKKTLKYFTIVFSFVLLAYILSKVDLVKFVHIINNVTPRYLFIALIFFAITPFIQTFRWLQALKKKVKYLYLLRQTVISYFFNNFFLAFIGGDIYRVYKLKNKVGNSDAVYSIFLARLTNMWGAVMIPFPFILITSFPLTDEYYRLAFLISLLSWICTIFILIFRGRFFLLLNRISDRGKNFENFLDLFSDNHFYHLLFSSVIFHCVNIVVHYFFSSALKNL